MPTHAHPTPAQAHWDTVYQGTPQKPPSWQCAHLETSLHWIQRLIPAQIPDAGEPSNESAWPHIADLGCGEATLVDDLLSRGYRRVTLVDLSSVVLERVIKRLALHHTAQQLSHVRHTVGDVCQLDWPQASVDLWHDRAVLHFLTEPEQAQRYATLAAHAVRPGGHLVLATFAPDGPLQCSNLQVCRYGDTDLQGLFGSNFRQIAAYEEDHMTPSGVAQRFQVWVAQRTG